MTDNPYSSPITDATSDASGTADDANVPLASLAKSVFIAWERLRIVYILALGLLTMMLAVPGVIANGSQLFGLRGIIMIAEGAIVANILYFAGPVTETYVRWLGYDRKWIRWFLFIGGTILTAMLAFASLASGLTPAQN